MGSIQTDSDYSIFIIIKNGTISVIINGNSSLRRQNEMHTVLRRVYVFISNRFYFQSERDVNVHTYYYYFTPPFTLYAHWIERFWPCTWYIFFLYPKTLDIIKYIELTTFFILLVTSQEKTRSYGTESTLKENFSSRITSISFCNKCFRWNFSKSMITFVRLSKWFTIITFFRLFECF